MGELPASEPTSELGRLYDAHGAGLYRYALMLLADAPAAEDAVHQVFATLLRTGRVAVVREMAGYLRAALRNECYAVLRRRRRWPEVPDEALLETVSPESAAAADARVALQRALRALPADQREVVHLHVFEGMTFQEVAAVTGDSINTVASRYRYALAHMRRVLAP